MTIYNKYLEARDTLVEDLFQEIYSLSIKINEKLSDNFIFEMYFDQSFTFSLKDIDSFSSTCYSIVFDKSEPGANPDILPIAKLVSSITQIISVDQFSLTGNKFIVNNFKNELTRLQEIYVIVFNDLSFNHFPYINTGQPHNDIVLPKKIYSHYLSAFIRGSLMKNQDLNTVFNRFPFLQCFFKEHISLKPIDSLLSNFDIQSEKDLESSVFFIDSTDLRAELILLRDPGLNHHLNLIRNYLKVNPSRALSIINDINEGTLSPEYQAIINKKCPIILENKISIPKIDSSKLYIDLKFKGSISRIYLFNNL